MALDGKSVPAGAKLSHVIMTSPCVGLLAHSIVCIQANDYVGLYTSARAAVRVYALTVGFNGGVHFGIGAALHETAALEYDKSAHRNQMLLSCVPGLIAYGAGYFMLYAHPLSVSTIAYSFSAMLISQMVLYRYDV